MDQLPPTRATIGDRVIKRGQKLSEALQLLTLAKVPFEQQFLAVAPADPQTVLRIYYVTRRRHEDKPLDVVALKKVGEPDTEFMVTHLSIYDSYLYDSRQRKSTRKHEYTPLEEISIRALLGEASSP